ncbi:Multicopper oxidase aurL2 [Metarhizium brunneum]|uniref:Laccase 1 n=1 Tax=Metarhizium brunneum TaxID=500148 RepID=A0A7D5Z4J8_9HYPO
MLWLRRAVTTLALAAVPVLSLQAHSHDDSFTPDIVLSVTRQNISIGGMYRETTLVNNSLPGPTLRIPEQKTIWIRVYNDIENDNVTIHWHGLAQAAYPFSDGAPLASQWPIPPKHFFDYELKAESGTAGTYYYHSHVGFQAGTATGALIVEDPAGAPYTTDGERLVFLQEYWSQSDTQIKNGLESIPLRWPGEPKGWLINGKSISNYRAVDPSTRALSVIDVEPGKTYRFRFVGATALSLALLGFEKHGNLEIIEADGEYTQPYPVDLLQIGSGQRYSALFHAKSCQDLREDGQLDYYIQLESRDRNRVVTNYAVLRYENACNMTSQPVATNKNPETPPLNLPPTIDGYLDYALQPLEPNNFPTAEEVTRRVMLNVQVVENRYFIWTINNYTWSEDADALPATVPQTPYLVSLYQNQSAYLPNYEDAVANGGIDPKTGTYPAKIGEVLEIVLQQFGGKSVSGGGGGMLDTHPWHGHGIHHYDVGGGRGAWDPDTVEEKLEGKQPVLRDTTMLYRYERFVKMDEKMGWRVWRIRVEQPGVWMVHCHTLQHMIQGMQTVWVNGDAEDILKVGKPDVEGYLLYGGNVYGNESHTPQVVHFDEMD